MPDDSTETWTATRDESPLQRGKSQLHDRKTSPSRVTNAPVNFSHRLKTQLSLSEYFCIPHPQSHIYHPGLAI